jgi:hypothetical protein
MILRSSTYTDMIQNHVDDFLMKIHGQLSLFVYPFSLRNSLNRLYHIRPDCFKPYNDFYNLMQYMLQFALGFGIMIPSGTFMYILESNDPYKYAVTTSINYIYKRFCTASDIKYRNVILAITEE